MAAVTVAACGGGSSSTSPETSDPYAPPTNVTWTTFQGVSIPCAEQGPADCPAVAPRGYQHNGAGAALAAISATIRMSVAADNDIPRVLGMLVAPNDARDDFAVNRQLISITTPVPEGKAPQVLGYVLDDYTRTRAQVSIITRQPDQSLTSNAAVVTWSAEGDWRLELPSTVTAPRVKVLTAVPTQNFIPLPSSN
ncbi:hypothetical protein [Gordonia pseudamarae]|uniref:hypothetical protein n=1 Tax=Gordonia pseudamarae TaxID=2831662 RepID=UPI001AFADCB0|nr:hypothetical protein [Gordonia pseudamarae]QHN28973.1 hypothetical protein GII33_23100 [Gordonia pseudamarae]